MKPTIAALLLIGSMSWAFAEPAPLFPSPASATSASDQRVTNSFETQDLVDVLKVLAKEAGRQVYVGPTVQGTVTIVLADVPFQEALRMVLAQQSNNYDFRLLDSPSPLLVVTAPERLAEVCLQCQQPRRNYGCPARMEYLLEHSPAVKVIDVLKAKFPDAQFTPHPTMNGFYARGSKNDLFAIKRELDTLDRAAEVPESPAR